MPAHKKLRLTLEQHIEIGKRLKTLRSDAYTIAAEVSPALKAKDVDRFLKSILAINLFRCSLDNLVCRDYPREFNAGIYYGEQTYPNVTAQPQQTPNE